MSKLTTHILDTALGKPAPGVQLELYEVDAEGLNHIVSLKSNEDGRTDVPLLSAENFQVGVYELQFFMGPYFRAAGHELDDPMFLDTVHIRFSIASMDQHYHVPLLVSPWAYSTYRGS